MPATKGAWATVQQVNIDPDRTGAIDVMYTRADELMQNDSPLILVAAIIDLDRFKKLNDQHGHEHGDLALKEVARVLTTCISEGDVGARLGGDEFAALATGVNWRRCRRVGDRLRGGLEEISDTVTASVGIVCRRLPLDGSDDVDSSLRHADRAMYEAKRQGGNLIHPVRFRGRTREPGGATEDTLRRLSTN